MPTFLQDFWRFVREMFDALLEQKIDELVLRLTLLVLILHGASDTILDVALKVLCGFLLLSPKHLKNPPLWALLCAVVWWMNATVWLLIDNHKFLMSYWTLACAVAVASSDPKRILAWNGRLLIGLTFLFAVGWKLIGGQYLNGEFFYHALLTDDRFEIIATTLGGVSPVDLDQAKIIEDAVKAYPAESTVATVVDSRRLLMVSLVISWWTLLIEAAIAIDFLFLQKSAAARRTRDWILLGFIATTYPIAPVLGFGYTLVILGFAACPKERTATRVAYLIVLVVLQLGRLPHEML
ncbi:MAG: hypothetical protein ACI8UO_002570 [Verrucomicrobiales bacterium]|jgi:hypothetical protein